MPFHLRLQLGILCREPLDLLLGLLVLCREGLQLTVDLDQRARQVTVVLLQEVVPQIGLAALRSQLPHLLAVLSLALEAPALRKASTLFLCRLPLRLLLGVFLLKRMHAVACSLLYFFDRSSVSLV